MADYPDVYADGFSFTINQAGLTLTLTRTRPAVPPMNEVAGLEIVARVRMGPVITESLSQKLQQALTDRTKKQEQTVTH